MCSNEKNMNRKKTSPLIFSLILLWFLNKFWCSPRLIESHQMIHLLLRYFFVNYCCESLGDFDANIVKNVKAKIVIDRTHNSAVSFPL